MADGYKLIIAGSRSIKDYGAVRDAVIDSGLWKKHKKTIEVVCGGAQGIDDLGLEFAENNGLCHYDMPANWDDIKVPGAVVKTNPSTGQMYNALAGFWRNQDMAEFADGLLLIWDGKSPGSLDMLARATKKGIEVHAYTYRQGRLSRLEGYSLAAALSNARQRG